ASPDIRLSKADAASSRDSVAPVAALAMIDLRSSIAYVQNRTLMVRKRSCAVSNHEDVASFETRPTGRSSGRGEFQDRWATFILDHAQLFAPVTCAKAAS